MISTAMLLAAGCTSDRTTPSFGVVGAWRSSIQFGSGAFAPVKDLEFLYVFNEGGTMTESSNYDAAPPVPPAYGVWRQVRPDEFEARYEFFMTAPSSAEALRTGAGWLPSGRGVLTERIKLSRDGQSFTSSIRFEAFHANGGKAEGGGNGTGRAVRIR
jgi:hypothetical protein